MVVSAADQGPDKSCRRGFRPCARFRPKVPQGESGWEAKGQLDLAKVRAAVVKA
jgi:hypothetical protein